jgi:hypothetical protein
MRNLIFKIYKLFQWKLSSAFVLVTILTVSAFAQSSGDSVFIINQTTTNNAAGVVADYLAGEIGEGLQDKFPCVDYSSPEDVKAVVDAARQKELLTGELSEEQIDNIVGAIGARYTVFVTVTVSPNGQTVVSGKVIDNQTKKTVSDRAANAEAAFANAESVAKNLLQDFSGIFKNRCEAHWTGSINFTKLIQMSTKTETSGPKSQSTETKSKNLSATADIVLQPMTLGFSGRSATQARVIQNYRYTDEYGWNQTAEIPCREPGRNTYFKKVSGDFKNIRTESGSGADVVSVFIQIFEDGRYSIYASGFKPIKTKVMTEASSNPPDCRPIPSSKTSENEDSKNFVYIDLKGQVDPKNPDVLSGKEEKGDIESGLYTLTWNLRLVQPNKKKK